MKEKSNFIDAALFGFVGAILGVIVTAYVLFATGILTAETQINIVKDSSVREWVGATSGLVGTIFAAFVAGIIGWKTLIPIRDQQKAQNDLAIIKFLTDQINSINNAHRIASEIQTLDEIYGINILYPDFFKSLDETKIRKVSDGFNKFSKEIWVRYIDFCECEVPTS